MGRLRESEGRHGDDGGSGVSRLPPARRDALLNGVLSLNGHHCVIKPCVFLCAEASHPHDCGESERYVAYIRQISALNFFGANQGEQDQDLPHPHPYYQSDTETQPHLGLSSNPRHIAHLGKSFLRIDIQCMLIEWVNILHTLPASSRDRHQQPFLPDKKPKPREVKRLAQGQSR